LHATSAAILEPPPASAVRSREPSEWFFKLAKRELPWRGQPAVRLIFRCLAFAFVSSCAQRWFSCTLPPTYFWGAARGACRTTDPADAKAGACAKPDRRCPRRRNRSAAEHLDMLASAATILLCLIRHNAVAQIQRLLAIAARVRFAWMAADSLYGVAEIETARWQVLPARSQRHTSVHLLDRQAIGRRARPRRLRLPYPVSAGTAIKKIPSANSGRRCQGREPGYPRLGARPAVQPMHDP
jgi:hypothetical protein